jgi:hypothetical protein
MADAQPRPVRLPRPREARPPRAVRLAVRRPPATAGPPLEVAEPRERRENVGATRRGVRLAVVFVAAIAGVYGLLVALARSGPSAGSIGVTAALELAAALAVVVGAVGTLVPIVAAPRAVELGERMTIVVGRFGRRYRFPGRDRLTVTVLQRFGRGPLAPVPLVSVEILGGSTRRSFLVDASLFEGVGRPDDRPA